MFFNLKKFDSTILIFFCFIALIGVAAHADFLWSAIEAVFLPALYKILYLHSLGPDKQINTNILKIGAEYNLILDPWFI